MLVNPTEETKPVVILPDGRFDIFFSLAANEPFHCSLHGLGSEPSQGSLAPNSVICAVSFKLLAAEFLLDLNLSDLVNRVVHLPADFWDITSDDLNHFASFCDKVSAKINGLLRKDIDPRKQKLFELIYASQGSTTVKELSEAAQWSSRQINRYFTYWFGLSLKTYCTILRYRASFNQLKAGRLFPEQDFVDQAHFIKNVKKYSGVTPKELVKNENDRFIQFSTLPRK